MKKIIVFALVLAALTGCSNKPDPAAAASPFETVKAVLGDRLVDFSESSGVVYVKFDARNPGSPNLVKKGILEDGRAVIRALHENPNFDRPSKVTLEGMFDVTSQTGQVSNVPVGRLVFDRPDPIAWENLPLLDDFESLLSVAEFPYN